MSEWGKKNLHKSPLYVRCLAFCILFYQVYPSMRLKLVYFWPFENPKCILEMMTIKYAVKLLLFVINNQYIVSQFIGLMWCALRFKIIHQFVATLFYKLQIRVTNLLHWFHAIASIVHHLCCSSSIHNEKMYNKNDELPMLI